MVLEHAQDSGETLGPGDLDNFAYRQQQKGS